MVLDLTMMLLAWDIQDETLRRAVQCFKGKNWKKIGECFHTISLDGVNVCLLDVNMLCSSGHVGPNLCV